MKRSLSIIFTVSLLSSGCVSTVPQGSLNTAVLVDPNRLNAQTSTAKETGYLCQVAKMPGVKPIPDQLDWFRSGGNGTIGYADLNSDGKPEVISGFSDENFLIENAPERHDRMDLYEGNRGRATQDTQYMIWSPEPSFTAPINTEFNLARHILPQDLNADGKDDVVFIQTGQDFDFQNAPNWHNDILISGQDGYTVKQLPGDKSWWHGGSIGDIDGDGDLDIIATPTRKHTVAAYINDGKGNFSFRHVLGSLSNWRSNHKYYNVTLWDVDKDGILDIVAGGDGTYNGDNSIHWGKGGGKFDQKPTLFPKGQVNRLMQDAVFSDLNGNGREEVILLVSNDSFGNGWPYDGFSVLAYELSGRRVSREIVIDRTDSAVRRTWFPYIAACDLGDDKDMDLVIENYGELYGSVVHRYTGRVVYENLDNSSMQRTKLAHKNVFFNETPSQIDEIQNASDKLGVAHQGYKPNQVYYPTLDGKRSGSTIVEKPRWVVVSEEPVPLN